MTNGLSTVPRRCSPGESHPPTPSHYNSPASPAPHPPSPTAQCHITYSALPHSGSASRLQRATRRRCDRQRDLVCGAITRARLAPSWKSWMRLRRRWHGMSCLLSSAAPVAGEVCCGSRATARWRCARTYGRLPFRRREGAMSARVRDDVPYTGGAWRVHGTGRRVAFLGQGTIGAPC